MRLPPIDVDVDATVIARPPEGWTMDDLWQALLAAGNNPETMTRNEDHVVVFTTKEQTDV